ncbi:MAG: hypothetical protein A3I44_00050 [Candidatus Sungbacteria bacterium RIFCSPLOWO2_02_FULL_51_17]|uniref:Type 4 fimbrial biogenesis protein PilX N-terminal domain-containing protein n=1 Tax=Candidatus Sungbacteria bacterium RIFCSPHIGHO2_02_FULL_51_29 TaxID=1802273 RepID=A0A1G2KQW1_9BACT|nr:MAG: hypothetical protein A2676_05485 [Candidatus Sungbacteria bacterium RIFCSPHIGHO2_01_FULL_51_22]OHA01770.1 MAG: hypothetical protein A3C16_02690 [Candidatus Sungbacteria bacterium RIFCSPHIGHO2_02_FULL_51_29]OHA07964.1 MAG: hypothetical protein A3B29_04180 [Candidatus Sungbacteria bacterium RIFCSPLOWO2_01_FULL_51_34]OHA11548.1 MAG: hypothetical protein A3I44_00050 [Candidatus Sungbacteria bacterium RIFCSPLOWO2_02_FULL_51_17]
MHQAFFPPSSKNSAARRSISASRGSGIIEVIVGVAIISIALWGLGTIAAYSHEVVQISGERVRATFLASEGVEAVKNMRDIGWGGQIGTLTASTNYYLAFDAAQERWRSTTTASTIDGFTRTFALYTVYRDANSDIVGTGTLDSGTKRVVVQVSWSRRGNTYQESISTYISDLFDN